MVGERGGGKPRGRGGGRGAGGGGRRSQRHHPSTTSSAKGGRAPGHYSSSTLTSSYTAADYDDDREVGGEDKMGGREGGGFRERSSKSGWGGSGRRRPRGEGGATRGGRGGGVSYTNSQLRAGGHRHTEEGAGEGERPSNAAVAARRRRDAAGEGLHSRSFSKDPGPGEETRISRQLRRLQREEDPDAFVAQMVVLNETLALQENLNYVQRAAHHLLDSVMDLLHSAPAAHCRMQAAHTMAFIGHLLQEDDVRFINLVLDGLNEKSDSASSTNVKVLLLLALKKAVLFDKHKAYSITLEEDILTSVQSVLESTEVMPIMVAAVEVIRAAYSVRPSVLQPLFQDLVDILVGWHIDHEQPHEVTQYVAQSLASFPDLWRTNADCGRLLLSQFVEDMEDYLQEVTASLASDYSPEEGSDPPQACATKVEYFLSVFSSVLASLPPRAAHGEPTLQADFLKESFSSVVSATEALANAGFCTDSSTLLATLNKVCVSMLRHGLSGTEHEEQLLLVLQLQRDRLLHSAIASQLSYLDMLNTMLQDHASSLPASLVAEVFGSHSPLRTLRLARDISVWEAALELHQSALALKNVPLLQDVYQYMLADLQLCHTALVKDVSTTSLFGPSTLLPDLLYTEQKAVAVLQYHLCAFAQLCQKRNSIISMWALRPSLLQLLALHLTPASEDLATQQPQVHTSLVTLLFYHCNANNYFVGSSSLVVGSATSSGMFSSFQPSISAPSFNVNVAEFNPSATPFTPSSSSQETGGLSADAADFQPSSGGSSTEDLKSSKISPEVVNVTADAAAAAAVTTEDSSVFGAVSTSQNLSIILKTLEDLLNLGDRCCPSALKVVLQWVVSAVSAVCGSGGGAAPVAALHPLLGALLGLARTTSRPAHQQLLIASTLEQVLLLMPLTEKPMLASAVSLCLHRLSSSDESLSRGYLNVLCHLPLSIVADAIAGANTGILEGDLDDDALQFSKTSFSGAPEKGTYAKGFCDGRVERLLLRHHQLRSNRRHQLPAIAFHQLITFMLDCTPNREADDWLQTTARLCRTLENTTMQSGSDSNIKSIDKTAPTTSSTRDTEGEAKNTDPKVLAKGGPETGTLLVSIKNTDSAPLPAQSTRATNNEVINVSEEAAVAVACDGSLPVLWRWLAWRVAQHCITNRLRTSLGKPQDTFLLIEVAVKLRLKQVKDCGLVTGCPTPPPLPPMNVGEDDSAASDAEGGNSTHGNEEPSPKSDPVSSTPSSGALVHYPALRVMLLLEFLDALERSLMMASDGCATSLQPVNKAVRAFFSTNRVTCSEGLIRLRPAAVVVALDAGQPHMAARHAEALLGSLPRTASPGDVERVAVLCARAFVSLRCPESVLGLQRYCWQQHGLALPWLNAAAHAAEHRHEDALFALQQFLSGKDLRPVEDLAPSPSVSWTDFDLNSPIYTEADPALQEFMVYQVGSCYSELCSFDEMLCWSTARAKDSLSSSGALNAYQTSDYATAARALSQFDCGLYAHMLDTLSEAPPTTYSSTSVRDWPLWRKLSHLELSAFRCITEAVYRHSSVLTCEQFLSLSATCRRDVEQLLQVSTLAELQPAVHLRLIVIQQLLLQAEGSYTSSAVPPASALHEGWGRSSRRLSALPTDLLPLLTRYSKMIAQFNSDITESAVSSLELVCVRQARKQRNLSLCQQSLLRLVGSSAASVNCPHYSAPVLHSCVHAYASLAASTNTFNTLTVSLVREASKLLYCGGAAELACSTLATVVLELNPPSLTGSDDETAQLSARTVLKLAKWLGKDSVQFQNMAQHGWTTSLLKVCLEQQPRHAPQLAGLGAAVLETAAVPEHEQLVAQCLALATVHCPDLAKTWYRLGSWCFRWGRSVVDSFLRSRSPLLNASDEARVAELLLPHCSALSLEHYNLLRYAVHDALAWLPQPDEEQEQDDQLADLRLEESDESRQYVQQLLAQALTEACIDTVVNSRGDGENGIPPLLKALTNVREAAVQRQYVLYTVAAQAYFKFFATASSDSPKYEAPQTSAALRLVRLVVKHAAQLRPVFEHAFAQHPTTPWKTIIPQLFARLNHSEGWVRESISELLCRLAHHSPHLIVLPAVVGSSATGSRATTTSITDMLAKYFHREGDQQKHVQPADGEFAQPSIAGQEEEEVADEFGLMEVEEDDTAELLSDSNVEENREVMHNCFNSLVNALTRQGTDGVLGAEVLVQELRRVTVLWDELWLGTLTQHQADLSRKLAQLRSEAARLESNSSLSKEDKTHLIKTKYEVIFKPLMLVLEQLWDISSSAPETPHERHFQETYGGLIQEAVHSLREPESYFEPQRAVASLRTLQQLLSQQRNSRRGRAGLSMSEISPRLANLQHTDVAMPGVLGRHLQVVRIRSVDDDVTILPSKTKPKKISFKGDDGRRYTYLFKGLEDLHLDERIMQFLAIVNTMLCSDDSERVYRAHHYSVVPLGPRSGLIQWVDDASPLFGLYVRWQHREAQALAYRSNAPLQSVLRPTELYYQKLSPLLKAAGVSVANRKDWPQEVVREVVKELIEETPSDLLSRELMASSPSSGDWWRSRRTFSISSAVMSMVGFVLGLGDRHLDNVLVRLTTGEVVHIDYNICFEKGRYLRVPENVPYRMTQNIENALGITGVEGVFRCSSERVLSTMREGREVLLTLLETFIYDPLVDWTHDADAGYAGAMYGGDTALASTVRERRQQMERVLTVTMFRVRTKEMTEQWRHNREEVEGKLQELAVLLDSLLQQQEHQETLQQTVNALQQQLDYLGASQSDSSHPANSIAQRLKEHNKQEARLENMREKVREQRDDLQAMLTEQERGFDQLESLSSLLEPWNAEVALTLPADIAVLDTQITARSQRQQLEKFRHGHRDLSKAMQQCRSLVESMREGVWSLSRLWQLWPASARQRHPLLPLLEVCRATLATDMSCFDAALSEARTVLADTAASNSNSNAAAVEQWLQTAHSTLQEQLQQMEKQFAAKNEALRNENIDSHKGADGEAKYATIEKLALHRCFLSILNNGSTGLVRVGELFSGAFSPTSPVGALVSEIKTCEIIHAVGSSYFNLPDSADETPTQESSGAHEQILLKENLHLQTGRCDNPSHSDATDADGAALTSARSELLTAAFTVNNLCNEALHAVTSVLQLSWSTACRCWRGDANDALPTLTTALVAALGGEDWQERLEELSAQIKLPENFSADRDLDSEAATVETVLASLTQICDDFAEKEPPFKSLLDLLQDLEDQYTEAVTAVAAADGALPQRLLNLPDVERPVPDLTRMLSPEQQKAAVAAMRVQRVQVVACLLQLAAITNLQTDASTTASDEDRRSLASALETAVFEHCRVCVMQARLLISGIMRRLLNLDRSPLYEAHEASERETLPAVAVSANDMFVRSKVARIERISENRCREALHSSLLAASEDVQWEHRAFVSSLDFTATKSATEEMKWYVSMLDTLQQQNGKLKPALEKIKQLKKNYFAASTGLCQKLFEATDGSSDQSAQQFLSSEQTASVRVDAALSTAEQLHQACGSVLRWTSTRRAGGEELRLAQDSFEQMVSEHRRALQRLSKQGTQPVLTALEQQLVLLAPPEKLNSKRFVEQATAAVSARLSEVSCELKGVALAAQVEGVRQRAAELRQLFVQHHKLISDVKDLLRSLAKFKDQTGTVVRDYLSQYRSYAESVTALIKKIQNEDFTNQTAFLRLQLQHFSLDTGVIYNELMTLCEETSSDGATPKPSFQQPITPAEGTDPRNAFLEPSTGALSSLPLQFAALADTSAAPQADTPEETTAALDQDKRHQFKRIISSKGAGVEHNPYALSVWRRVKAKLEGRDRNTDPSLPPTSVAQQVDQSILDAKSVEHLAALYEGWTPWV